MASDLGILLMSFDVIPSHVLKLPRLTDVAYVFCTGLNVVLCRYLVSF